MCGICGFVNLDGEPASAKILRQMRDTIVHRGPDDTGESIDGPVALGHQRLSIIDVAHGHQPMHWTDPSLAIVYNGEIYNHREIRNELPPTHFETQCDTETLLASYARWGSDCVEKLRGMFAFAIHDRLDGSVFLVRDRLGVKPLYVYESATLFAFASEIKALLAHPGIAAEVDEAVLPVQLALKYTLDDRTLFKGIRRLPAGHWLRVSAGQRTERQYWDVRFTPKRRYASEADALADFRSKFHDAVESRLMSDVPLGVFLSGGIDSSVIAASMATLVTEPIKAFSVGFAEKGYSELGYSRAVARHIGADVREVVVTPQQWFAAWPRMVYHEDEPIAHPSSIPLHFVSELAARDVKVVLTGEGSDELLGGYERYYQTLANLRMGRLLPRGLHGVTRRLIDLLPDRFLPKRKAVRTSLYLENDLESLYLDNYAAFPRWTLRDALQPQYGGELCDRVYDGFHELLTRSDADELLDQILYTDLKTYLHELLMKQDQMSMSASLESRVPFLDHHLVEFVCSLPLEFKLKGFATKRILRMALGDTIPREIVTRGKKGFPTPIKEWFRGEFHGQMQGLLLGAGTRIYEYVRPEYVRATLERHRAGEWDLQEQIWTLANLEIWHRIFIDGQSPDVMFHELQEEAACGSFG